MSISAVDVNKLRQITGAGMMDCKKALTEAGGDYDKAIELLRKKGQKVAANRSDKEAKEGVVLAKVTSDGKNGVIICVNCETDFVAKNEEFVEFVDAITRVAVSSLPKTIDELKTFSYDGKISIAEKIMEQVGKIGEKIDITRYETLVAENVAAYIHPGNRLAVIAGFNKANHDEAAKNVAMQVAAMAPVAVDKGDVSDDIINKELDIAKELARQEGKPENMLDKIAQGRVQKFYKESTLLNQEFIRDNKKTVAQYLAETDKSLAVTGFKRIALG